MISIYIAEYSLKEGEKKHQIEHRTGMELLRLGLAELYDIHFEEEQLPEKIKRGIHGKPFLEGNEGLHFNISHCTGMAACGFADVPMGVDAEKMADFKKPLLKRFLTEQEQAFMNEISDDPVLYREMFYRFWTLKESYIKWNGMGFSFAPKDVSFEIKLNEKHEVLAIECSDKTVCCMQEKVGEDTILSVCIEQRAKEAMQLEFRNV